MPPRPRNAANDNAPGPSRPRARANNDDAPGPSRARAANGNNANANEYAINPAGAPPTGIQARMTAEMFSNYLDGFVEVQPRDLLGPGKLGGRVRYRIEELDARGRVKKTLYRLGGWLVGVDPMLRFIKLYNPYAKVPPWSAQLKKPNERVTLWFFAMTTAPEVAAMRAILDGLERKTIKIVKRP